MLDLDVRPDPPIHHQGVAERLGVPERVHRRRGHEWPGVSVEVSAVLGVVEGTVRVERTVLKGERDLVIASARCVADLGRRAWQAKAVFLGVAEQIEPGKAGVHVHTRDAERVVVIPERARARVVRIEEQHRAWADVLRGAEVGALERVARGIVLRVRQPPRLGVHVTDCRRVPAVKVRDNGNGARVRRRAHAHRVGRAGWIDRSGRPGTHSDPPRGGVEERARGRQRRSSALQSGSGRHFGTREIALPPCSAK